MYVGKRAFFLTEKNSHRFYCVQLVSFLNILYNQFEYCLKWYIHCLSRIIFDNLQTHCVSTFRFLVFVRKVTNCYPCSIETTQVFFFTWKLTALKNQKWYNLSICSSLKYWAQDKSKLTLMQFLSKTAQKSEYKTIISYLTNIKSDPVK